MADGGEEFNFLGTVKLLLGIDDDSLDVILQTYLQMTIQKVLNYCNIFELPSALNYLVCQMTAEAYKEITSKNSSGQVVGAVNSISEGGRSVGFADSSQFQVAIEDKISHTVELNRYKKLFRK